LLKKAASKYSIVVMTAKRARRLLVEEKKYAEPRAGGKFIGVALAEIASGELVVKTEE
jgi:DNA-directed RNA polymerase omega subunit